MTRLTGCFPLLLTLLALPSTNPPVTPVGFEVSIPIEVSFPQQANYPPPGQNPGYYRPVPQQQPYRRQCGTVATDVCPTNVAIPPGATGEQLYQMCLQANQAGRKGDALTYLMKSADMGYDKAEWALGTDYQEGRGMTHDPQKAVYYLNAAARQGNRAAESKLGEMYENGHDVPQNQAKAIEYYKAAAAQHSSTAEFSLGLDYEYGRGLPHDRSLAIRYLRASSADGGDSIGNTMADTLAKAPASQQFHNMDEIRAFVHPQIHMKPGDCGPVPVLSTIINRYGFDQMHVWCNKHPGCPYYPNNEEARIQYCYSGIPNT